MMRKERGVVSLLQVAAVLVAGAALIGAIYALTHYVGEWINVRDAAIKQSGYDDAERKYVERDNKQLLVITAERDRLLREREAKEKEHETQLKQKEAESATRLATKQKDYDSFIADINAGRIVWRGADTARATPAPGADRSAASALAVSPDACAGYLGGGVVPGEAQAVFCAWLSEARRADRVLEKLSLCRGVLAIDRGEGLLPRPQ